MLQIRLPWNTFLLRTRFAQLAQPQGAGNQLPPVFLHFFALLCGWSDELPSNKGEQRVTDQKLLDELRGLLRHDLASALIQALESTVAPSATVSAATIQHVLQVLITVSNQQLSRGTHNGQCKVLISSRCSVLLMFATCNFSLLQLHDASLLSDALAVRAQRLVFSLRGVWEQLRPPDSGGTADTGGSGGARGACVSIDLFDHVDLSMKRLHAQLAPQAAPTSQQTDGQPAAANQHSDANGSGQLLDEPMGELEADDAIEHDGLRSSMHARNGADEIDNLTPQAALADEPAAMPISAAAASPKAASLATPMDMSR